MKVKRVDILLVVMSLLMSFFYGIADAKLIPIDKPISVNERVFVSSDLHGSEGLIDMIILAPGFYRYSTENLDMGIYLKGRGNADVDRTVRPDDCIDPFRFRRTFGEFSVEQECRLYLSVENDEQVDWSLTIIREE